MTNQNQYSPRFIPNNQRGNYYAFRRDLTQAQQNNPLNKTLNFQPSTSNNINRQGPVKRQCESQRDQSRMDVNFHQAREENDREGHTSPYVNIIHHNKIINIIIIKNETEFLGHIVTTNGIKTNPNKTKAITNFP